MMSFHELEITVTSGVLLLCGLFFLFSLVRHFSHGSRIPYPIWLLGFGTIMGLAAVQLSNYGNVVGLAPPVVFYVILPVLLFDTASKIRLGELKKVAIPIGFFASVGVLISMLVATGGFFLLPDLFPEWTVLDVLLLSAILSATDPVAVSALFKSFSVPEKLELLVEGESLFNDGTVVVLFSLLWALIEGQQSFSLTESVGQFTLSVAGGLLVGYILGRAAEWILHGWKEEHPPFVTLTISLVMAHGTFLLADHLLHVSGVLAVVVVGLMFGNRTIHHLDKHREHFVRTFWEYAAFLANSCLFFLLGLEFTQHLYTLSLITVPLILLYFLVARAVAVYGGSLLLRFFQHPIPSFWQHVLNLGGLRGALSIALILSLPFDYEYRLLFLCMAYVVVIVSLTGNVWGLAKYLATTRR